MNPNIQVEISGWTTSLKFLTWNVDQAVREEKYEKTKWMNRKDRVVSLIKETGADIINLQEMRKLSGAISTNRFLAEFDDYFYEVGYRNPSELAFGQAILYRPSKVYPVKVVKKWLSSTPDDLSDNSGGFGYIVLGIKFVPVHQGKVVVNAKPFWVFNTHFGLDEEVKTQSCHTLKEIIAKETGGTEQFVLSGDFNFFPDKSAAQQRQIMRSFQDLGAGAKTLSGRAVEGTFIGYEHDEFKADLNSMISRLDNIYASSGITGTNPTLYTKTMLEVEPEELTTRDYPSDHLPILIDLKIL